MIVNDKSICKITAHTLNEAWLDACKLVFTNGHDIQADIEQKEINNLHIRIENGFEVEHDLYFKYFSKDSYDQVMRVYSKTGDKELQKNYWERIYANQGINQVERVEKILSEDPLSKSATIVLADITKEKQSCVLDINFRIRDEKVDMTIIFKSSDVAKKLIPDIVVLTQIHEKISRDHNLARGTVDAFILSAQIHKADFFTVKSLIKEETSDHYYDATKVINNWNGDAEQWDSVIENPEHYVNIENGYKRFIDFANNVAKEHITKNQTVLDSGCGTGIIANLLKDYSNNVYGIDIADKMITVARKKRIHAKFVLGNCLDIPFEDKFFSAVVTRGVLISHVEKDYAQQFIDEAKRVLCPGGLFVFDFITHYNEAETEKLKKKAIFDQKSLSKILIESGFKILEFNGDKSNRVNAVACIKE